MPPKEMMQVTFDDTGDGTWKARFVNGQEVKDWKNGPEMMDFIKSLIQDGWAPQTGVGDRYIFERELKQQP